MNTNRLFLSLAISVASLASVVAAPVEYTAGHGDIGLAYHDNELELHYHFGNGAVIDGMPLVGEIEYEPDEAFVRVGDNSRVTTITNAPFLGTTTGDPVWVLPQSNIAGRPFLGIAAEELDSSFSAATIRMTSFSGPGNFAIWQPDGIGGNNVFWQSSNGLDSTDLLPLTIGGHDHFNFGFTAEGIYDIGLTANATHLDDGSLTDVGTFRFVVGSATAIPEPGSLAVLTLAGLAVFARRRNRRIISPALMD